MKKDNKKKNNFSWRENRKLVVTYLIGVVFTLGLHFLCGKKEYFGDAEEYWRIGAEYGLDKFRLLNFDLSYRGYLFPLFTYVIQKLAHEGLGTGQTIFNIVTSLIYTFFFIIAFPKMINCMFKIVVPLKCRLLFLIACIIMLRGLILYPLTDLPGIILVCSAIYFFLALMQDNIKNRGVQIFYAVCIGISLGGAYYVRPIYFIIWILFGGIILISVFKERKWVLLFSIVGMLIVSAPQIYINQKNFGTYSPMIQTQLFYGGSLYLNQLKWGISTQKYETNVDVSAVDIPLGMIFEDSIGATLLEETGKIYSYPRYVIFCLRHFADMACIYLKHIFNGMDIVYPNAYIQKVYSNRFIVQFFNYSLIFAGLEGLLFFIKKKCWDRLTVGMSITYCFPILLVIPTAVETRFFVGAHLVLYLFAPMALADKEWWRKIWQCKWKKAGAYLLFLGVCFILNSQTFNCYGIPLW